MQVLEIAAGLLAEVARRSEPGIGARDGGQVMIDQVVIGAGGRVVLDAAPHGEHNERPSVTVVSTATSVEAVLADLAKAGVAGRADPSDEQLLAELDRARTLLPVTGVSDVAQMVTTACGAFDREAVRAELVALVRAVAETTGSGPLGGPPSRVPGVDHGRRSTSGGTGAVARRTRAWLLSVVVLAAVVLLEVALLRDDIVADVDLLLDAGRAGSGPSTPPEADGLPVPAFAPAAAGTVSAVDLRLLEPCAPGAPCSVRVLVRLVPAPDPQTVTWSYRVVDRCTGAVDTAPGGSVAVPPGSDQAVTVDVVALPPVPAAAVVAVTDRPAVAAAEPVLVGSCDPNRQSR